MPMIIVGNMEFNRAVQIIDDFLEGFFFLLWYSLNRIDWEYKHLQKKVMEKWEKI